MCIAYHYSPTTWLNGHTPCCLPWPLAHNDKSSVGMLFWFCCADTLFKCQKPKIPKAYSYGKGMTEWLSIAFQSYNLKLPSSELWMKQREKAKLFSILFLFSYYNIKRIIFHGKIFKRFVIVTCMYTHMSAHYNK